MNTLYPSLVLLLGLGFMSAAAAEPLNYAEKDLWLCHPDNLNACDTDLSTTTVLADGSTKLETFNRAEDADVDCFYVYPTVSNDPGGNSDAVTSPEERRVIQVQFARFGEVCRTFAPLYRQVTLTALRARFTENPMSIDRMMAYNDVKAAWDYYLKHDNDGRGVVLIGHSQGAGVLSQLIASEIEGKPVADQIISALLIGTSNVRVPEGRDVGDTFKEMALCRDASQTGCIVNFASFRSTVLPPENTLFGRPRDGKGSSACNNPAALAGGKTFLDAYLSNGLNIAATADSERVVWTTSEEVKTAFVRVPGLLSGECVSHDGLNYLQVTVNSDVNDPRTDVIDGDVMAGGNIVPSWGLHLIDMHLAMGDMINLVESQADAYLSKQ